MNKYVHFHARLHIIIIIIIVRQGCNNLISIYDAHIFFSSVAAGTQTPQLAFRLTFDIILPSTSIIIIIFPIIILLIMDFAYNFYYPKKQ